MANTFIDAEMAVYTLLTNAGFTAVLEVPSAVSDTTVWIKKTGGQRVGVLDSSRLQISVVGPDRTECYEVSEEVYNMLLDSPHFIPGAGLIDYVRSEGSPVEVPFKDQLKNYLFTISVESRAS